MAIRSRAQWDISSATCIAQKARHFLRSHCRTPCHLVRSVWVVIPVWLGRKRPSSQAMEKTGWSRT